MTWIIHKTCLEQGNDFCFLESIVRGSLAFLDSVANVYRKMPMRTAWSTFLPLLISCHSIYYTIACVTQQHAVQCHFGKTKKEMQDSICLSRVGAHTPKLVAHFLPSWIGNKLYKITTFSFIVQKQEMPKYWQIHYNWQTCQQNCGWKNMARQMSKYWKNSDFKCFLSKSKLTKKTHTGLLQMTKYWLMMCSQWRVIVILAKSIAFSSTLQSATTGALASLQTFFLGICGRFVTFWSPLPHASNKSNDGWWWWWSMMTMINNDDDQQWRQPTMMTIGNDDSQWQWSMMTINDSNINDDNWSMG